MRVIFKFSGGPLDGKKVVGEPGKPGEAEKYYALSYHGRVGQRFRTASDYAVKTLLEERLQVDRPHRFQQHVYEVIDRIDNGDVVLVQTRYVPGNAPRGRKTAR
jgi:hypothetical protein